MAIHATAVIDRSAELEKSVEVGPYAIIEAGVRIGAGTRVWPHAFIASGTHIGERCQIHPFTVIGHHPQDLAWKALPSYTEIGDDVVLREHCQIHRGTMAESKTVIGNRCYLMSVAHVAHNCVLGEDVKIATNSVLAGHVHVGDKTFISGNSAVHQFVRIGELCMISGGMRVINDVPSFMMFGPAGVVGINLIGLRRAGFTAEERTEIRAAYKQLYRSGESFRAGIESVTQSVKSEPGRRLVEFLRGASKRGFERYLGKIGAPDVNRNEGESELE